MSKLEKIEGYSQEQLINYINNLEEEIIRLEEIEIYNRDIKIKESINMLQKTSKDLSIYKEQYDKLLNEANTKVNNLNNIIKNQESYINNIKSFTLKLIKKINVEDNDTAKLLKSFNIKLLKLK